MQTRLRFMILLERDAAGSDRDQRASRGDEAQPRGNGGQAVGTKVESRSSRAAPAGSFWPTLQAARASTKCSQSDVSTL